MGTPTVPTLRVVWLKELLCAKCLKQCRPLPPPGWVSYRYRMPRTHSENTHPSLHSLCTVVIYLIIYELPEAAIISFILAKWRHNAKLAFWALSNVQGVSANSHEISENFNTCSTVMGRSVFATEGERNTEAEILLSVLAWQACFPWRAGYTHLLGQEHVLKSYHVALLYWSLPSGILSSERRENLFKIRWWQEWVMALETINRVWITKFSITKEKQRRKTSD